MFTVKCKHIPKRIKSLRNREFSPVYRSGKRAADLCFVLYFLENGTDSNRLGITVSKKIGNSVVRSRVKRIIREAYRLHEQDLLTGLDIVIVARPDAADKKSTDMEVSLMRLAKRLKIRKEKVSH